MNELLLRMLPSALGRNGGNSAFKYLEQRLLNALSGNVTGYGHVFALARDLVDLIDVNNAPFGLCYIVVCGLKQL